MKYSKDKVQVKNDRGMLRLRWTYIKRESLNLGLEDTRVNRSYAHRVASEIESDIRCGTYDVSKNKYRLRTVGNSGLTCSELFEKFAKHKRTNYGVSDRSIETRYEPICGALQKWLDMAAHEVGQHQARDFLSVQLETVTNKTAKERSGLLSSCWDWAIHKELIAVENPWTGIATHIKPLEPREVKAFSRNEVLAIQAGFKNSQHFNHYVNFVRFLFGTACRFGEAAGLQWQHFGSDYKNVWIGQSYTRGYFKETKNKKNRIVVLSETMQDMLARLYQQVGPAPNDLAFSSPKGLPICDSNFRKRPWKTILSECDIEYRKPYATRHTAISHALENGADIAVLAKQVGNSVKTLERHYHHVVNPKSSFMEF